MSKPNAVTTASRFVMLGVILTCLALGGCDARPDPGQVPPATSAPAAPIETTASPSPVQSEPTAPVVDVEALIQEKLTWQDSRGKIDGSGSYPAAYGFDEWLWDYVGPGWALETRSTSDPYHDAGKFPAAYIYLVTPGGTYVELRRLPKSMGYNVSVVSWHEDSKMARIRYNLHDAMLYDLRSGAEDPLAFSVDGEPSTSHQFVAANADGVELWNIRSDSHDRFYRWDPAGGWSVAKFTGKYPYVTNFGGNVSVTAYTSSADGDKVFLGAAHGPESHYEIPKKFLVYSLSDESVATVPVKLDTGVFSIYDAEWVGDNRVRVRADRSSDGPNELDILIDEAGKIAAARGGPERPARGEWPRVLWGESTAPWVSSVSCGC